MLSRKFVASTLKISTLSEPVPAPYMRREFSLDAQADQATLTVSALGFYRVFLNGAELTRGHLSPYISNLDDVIYYDSYDVTDRLRAGRNCLAFVLGNGMRDCFGGYVWDFDKVAWRGAPAVAFALNYQENGQDHLIEADESVLCHDSPIYMNDLRFGEFYDARNEIEGWMMPGLDTVEWHRAFPVETPRGESRIGIHEPIIIEKEYGPVDVRESYISRVRIDPDENLVDYPADEHRLSGWLFDFGENNAGVVRLKVKGERDQKIILQFGDFLDNATGGLDLRNMHFAPINYDHRAIYILKGDPDGEEYIPSFTYFGFRYCLAIGMTQEQAVPEAMTCLKMHTKLEPLAEVSGSDPILNGLWQAAQRSNLANFFHFPTDCPHREKNGWTGDMALSAEEMILSLSVDANVKEWLYNIRKAQRPNGLIPEIIPTGEWGTSKTINPLWDKVLVDMPYYIWKYRGDEQIVRDNAEAIVRLIRLMDKCVDASETGLISEGLGDWCPYDRLYYQYLVPERETGTYGCIEACQKAAVMLDAIGQADNADFVRGVLKKLTDAVRTHIIDHEECCVASRSQTGQAMALRLGLFTEAEEGRAFDSLVSYVHANDDLLNVGVIGSRYIFDALSDHGAVDLAMDMLVTKRRPSLGSYIADGWTTLPESVWNHEVKDPGSQNHHFLADCCSGWFLRALGGLHINPNDRNVHEVRLAPCFTQRLTEFSCAHESIDGRLALSWRREGEAIALNVTVPQAMAGEIVLSGGWHDAQGRKVLPAVSGTYILSK